MSSNSRPSLSAQERFANTDFQRFSMLRNMNIHDYPFPKPSHFNSCLSRSQSPNYGPFQYHNSPIHHLYQPSCSMSGIDTSFAHGHDVTDVDDFDLYQNLSSHDLSFTYDNSSGSNFMTNLMPQMTRKQQADMVIENPHPPATCSLTSSIYEESSMPQYNSPSDCSLDFERNFHVIGEPWLQSELDATCTPATTTMDSCYEEEESSCYDKPYAQLIYEALKQAPCNRMVLRDIYEWFKQNTNKPRESGTNGWQNSIRHNLSMNKAFENERSDPCKGAKKANSVWILTDHAAKHGVESTTRFRKHTQVKKGIASKTPAIERQRSGARGGRAARRAARLRKQVEIDSNGPLAIETLPTATESQIEYIRTINADELAGCRCSPGTPPDYQDIGAMYTLPAGYFYEYEDDRAAKFAADNLLNQTGYLQKFLSFHPATEDLFDTVSRLQME